MQQPSGLRSPAAYFERVDTKRFRATEHVGGGWNPAEQHVAPAFGLLAHAVEADRDARRSDGLRLARLSYDILGIIPIDVVDIEVAVLRPGRTIELVEARLSHAGRVALILRAWIMQE
ncbi:acyl-CoA thioesterase domain-containing protein [Lysobacter sp. 2RAB21]